MNGICTTALGILVDLRYGGRLEGPGCLIHLYRWNGRRWWHGRHKEHRICEEVFICLQATWQKPSLVPDCLVAWWPGGDVIFFLFFSHPYIILLTRNHDWWGILKAVEEIFKRSLVSQRVLLLLVAWIIQIFWSALPIFFW
jgi:hypothetical protein